MVARSDMCCILLTSGVCGDGVDGDEWVNGGGNEWLFGSRWVRVKYC